MADSREIMRGLRAKADRVARSVARDALKAAMAETPVDTGEARGNWRVEVGGVDTDHDAKRRTPEAQAEGAAKIAGFGIGKKATISNTAPYAAALEYGADGQPPHGMVRKTAAKVPTFVRRAVKRERGK